MPLGFGPLALLRSQIQTQLELAKLAHAHRLGAVTNTELRAAYAQDPARFSEPASATLAPYLQLVWPGATAHYAAAALEQAEQFYGDIAKGRNPDEAATVHAMAAIAALTLRTDDVEPELAQTAIQLSRGQWTPPLRTSVGWAVARVESVQPAVILPLDRVRDRVKLLLQSQRGEAVLAQRLAQLRANGEVVDLVAW